MQFDYFHTTFALKKRVVFWSALLLWQEGVGSTAILCNRNYGEKSAEGYIRIWNVGFWLVLPDENGLFRT